MNKCDSGTDIYAPPRRPLKGNHVLSRCIQTPRKQGGEVRMAGKNRGGTWTKEERERHINQLELLAAVLRLKIFGKSMTNLHVLMKIDNYYTTAVNYIN